MHGYASCDWLWLAGMGLSWGQGQGLCWNSGAFFFAECLTDWLKLVLMLRPLLRLSRPMGFEQGARADDSTPPLFSP